MTPKRISKLPKFVQLRANRTVRYHVEPAQHRGEVEFYSIYLGEPGTYQWVADFANSADARNTTNKLALAFNCGIDRSQYDTVMGTPAPEPQPKGHPHAALMAEYAKDAAETDKPWERWEYRRGDGEWCAVGGHPYWTTNDQFRRKPNPPKIIKVNGFEVPAPIAEPPAESELVWVATTNNPDFAAHVRYVSEWDFHKFQRGLLHTTREAAVTHAKAMLGIDPKGDV